MALQLEVGKYYRTRDGQKRGPIFYHPEYESDGKAYGTRSDEWWSADGLRTCSDGTDAKDLIAEWHDTPDLTAITTPFGLLGEATQEALRAHGGPYEVWHKPGWVEDISHPDDWPEWAWRVKPAPKVETVTEDWYLNDDGRLYTQTLIGPSIPVRVTFTRTNGVIDLDSYKVEAR